MANRKHHAIDTATNERWALLGNLLRARRIELGYIWRTDFAEAKDLKTSRGNRNVRMINAIENNERAGTYQPGRLEQFARAYEVTPESVYAVLEGTADELAPAVPAARAVPGEPPGWTPPVDLARQSSDRPYADRIWERLRQLAGRGVMDPDGAQVFPGSPADAKTWDGTTARGLDLPNRVWLLADLQRSDGDRAQQAGANSA